MLEIWGQANAVAAARARLLQFVADHTKPQPQIAKQEKVITWAHTPSVNAQEKSEMENRLKREALRQVYRRAPLPDMIFPFQVKLAFFSNRHIQILISTIAHLQGSFIWPGDRPDHVLGRAFEALDPIRMKCSTYITFDPTKSIFIVAGFKKDDVQEALLRLRKTYYQVVARESIANKLYLYNSEYSKIPEAAVICLNPFRQTTAQAPLASPPVCPRLDGQQHMLLHNSASLVKKLEGGLRRALSVAGFWKGFLRMRVRLGVFILTSYQNTKTLTLPEFEAMMLNPQVRGHVTPG